MFNFIGIENSGQLHQIGDFVGQTFEGIKEKCNSIYEGIRSSTTNQKIRGALGTAAIGLIYSGKPKDLSGLIGKQLITAEMKTIAKKTEKSGVEKARIYLAIGAAGGLASILDCKKIADPILATASKMVTKDAKVWVKGKKSASEILLSKETSQYLQENLQKTKNCLPSCKKSEDDSSEEFEPIHGSSDGIVIVPMEEIESDETSASSLWTKSINVLSEHSGAIKKVGVVTALLAAGTACYAGGVPYAGMELLTTASKMGTIVLRELDVISALSIAAEVAGIGVGFGSAMKSGSDSAIVETIGDVMVDSTVSFAVDVVADTIKNPLKGKLLNRPWHSCGSEKQTGEEEEEISDSEDSLAEQDASLTPEQRDAKIEEKLPSAGKRLAVLGAIGGLGVAVNIMQPAGGMIIHKVTGTFAALTDSLFINGRSNPETFYKRLAIYGGSTLAAAAADGAVYYLSGYNMGMTKLVGITALKIFATKEAKNLPNVDFDSSKEEEQKQEPSLEGIEHRAEEMVTNITNQASYVDAA